MKSLFKFYDADQSGKLNLSEITNILSDSLNSYINLPRNGQKKAQLSLMIDKLSHDILDQLNKDSDEQLSWAEFKFFFEKVMINNLNEFLEL